MAFIFLLFFIFDFQKIIAWFWIHGVKGRVEYQIL